MRIGGQRLLLDDQRLRVVATFADLSPAGRPRIFGARPNLPLAEAPAVMEIGATGSTTLHLSVHVTAPPASGWLSFRVTTRCVTPATRRRTSRSVTRRAIASPGPSALLPGA